MNDNKEIDDKPRRNNKENDLEQLLYVFLHKYHSNA